MTAYTISAPRRWVRHVLRVGMRTFFHLACRVTVSGKENVPANGPYLIAFNHVSMFDPPAVLAFWPVPPEAVGAAEVWQRKGESLLARLYGGIPIRRGEVDRTAMERIVAALRAGRPLAISPEGTRSRAPGLQQAKPGVLYLMERTGATVVPVAVVGTTDDLWRRITRGLFKLRKRPVVTLTIGQPLTGAELAELALPARAANEDDSNTAPRDARQRQVDALMRCIAAMLPDNYRGYYR